MRLRGRPYRRYNLPCGLDPPHLTFQVERMASPLWEKGGCEHSPGSQARKQDKLGSYWCWELEKKKKQMWARWEGSVVNWILLAQPRGFGLTTAIKQGSQKSKSNAFLGFSEQEHWKPVTVWVVQSTFGAQETVQQEELQWYNTCLVHDWPEFDPLYQKWSLSMETGVTSELSLVGTLPQGKK